MTNSTTSHRVEKVKNPSRTAASRMKMADTMQAVGSPGFAQQQAEHNQQRAAAFRDKFARFGIARRG